MASWMYILANYSMFPLGWVYYKQEPTCLNVFVGFCSLYLTVQLVLQLSNSFGLQLN